MSEDDNLLSRWSKRKRAVAKEAAAEVDPAPNPPPKPDEKVAAQVARREEEHQAEGAEPEDVLLARLGLPSPEALGPGDDFSAFMQAGVPEAIRRRALRRLWRSNPVLANVDGLNDYDEDFNSPEETMKILKTAYRVGKGFLRPEPEPAPPDGQVAGTAEDPVESVPETNGDAVEATLSKDDGAANTSEQVSPPSSTGDAPPPRPPRMRFRT